MPELKLGPTNTNVAYVGPSFVGQLSLCRTSGPSFSSAAQLFCRYRKIINTISAKAIAAMTRHGLIG